MSDDACNDAPRDLAWEALNDAMGVARLVGEYSLYLMLERVMEARETGTLGRWVMELECERTTVDLHEYHL